MAVAKPMITEVFSLGHIFLHRLSVSKNPIKIQYLHQVFSTSVPALVTTSFATVYLMSMAAGKFHFESVIHAFDACITLLVVACSTSS